MRTFQMMMLVCLATAFSPGCAGDDDDTCGSTDDCDDPGLNGDVCPSDAPQRCEEDPDAECVILGIDCVEPSFACGGSQYSCSDWPEDRANCCNGEFHTCPGSVPYYCPDRGRCEETPCSSTDQCTMVRKPCGNPE